MTVRVGLFLTNQNQPGSDLVRGLHDQLRLARAGRDHGWDSVFAGHHYLSESLSHIQPLPYLARLAAETGDMQVGIGINLLALQNPVDVAESYASLDIITGGRLVFGVGLGYRKVEYDAFGIDGGEKVRRFQENLRLVQELWTGDEVSADLPWCRLDGVRLNVLPVQRPRPPLWMAANSDPAVARAAKLADTWMINPHATVETIERQLGLFRETRAAEGKGEVTELPLMREVFCAPTRSAAEELARPWLERKYEVYAQWGQDKVITGEGSFERPYEDLARQRFIVGSPDDCLEALLKWRDTLGVDHFLLRTQWPGMPVEHALDSVDLLAREVVPTLRAA
ncbi:MAG: LLM class flavin-dependent oxidoreductase [Streptosporangiales bacterium]|nr:LLM class flavin-dependent oxidoreductase [Streptosporangiales bacterium]